MNQVKRMDTLDSLTLTLIDDKYKEQFVYGTLDWYKDYEWLGFHSSFKRHYHIPNVFHFLEYPTLTAESVCNLFIESDIERTLREVGSCVDRDQIEKAAIDTFNNSWEHIYANVIGDIMAVLDKYRLFYIYQDDANEKAMYFNLFVKEVW